MHPRPLEPNSTGRFIPPLHERIQRAAPNDAVRLAEQAGRQAERKARRAARRRG